MNKLFAVFTSIMGIAVTMAVISCQSWAAVPGDIQDIVQGVTSGVQIYDVNGEKFKGEGELRIRFFRDFDSRSGQLPVPVKAWYFGMNEEDLSPVIGHISSGIMKVDNKFWEDSIELLVPKGYGLRSVNRFEYMENGEYKGYIYFGSLPDKKRVSVFSWLSIMWSYIDEKLDRRIGAIYYDNVRLRTGWNWLYTVKSENSSIYIVSHRKPIKEIQWYIVFEDK